MNCCYEWANTRLFLLVIINKQIKRGTHKAAKKTSNKFTLKVTCGRRVAVYKSIKRNIWGLIIFRETCELDSKLDRKWMKNENKFRDTCNGVRTGVVRIVIVVVLGVKIFTRITVLAKPLWNEDEKEAKIRLKENGWRCEEKKKKKDWELP